MLLIIIYKRINIWAFGLVVWFSLRVREVPSSILGMPPLFVCLCNELSSCVFVIELAQENPAFSDMIEYLQLHFF